MVQGTAAQVTAVRARKGVTEVQLTAVQVTEERDTYGYNGTGPQRYRAQRNGTRMVIAEQGPSGTGHTGTAPRVSNGPRTTLR